MTNLVTPAEMAAAAQVTEKHVRRMISRAVSTKLLMPNAWHGAHMQIVEKDGEFLVEFASLPDHVRDAVLVRQNQLDLPLPAPDASQ